MRSGGRLAGAVVVVVAAAMLGQSVLEEGIDAAIPMPVLAASLFARFDSRRPDAYSNKVLAALRHQFGGHAVQNEPTPSAK